MVRLTATFILLPVISVHTLAFSWRMHDFSRPFPDAEHPMPQDLSILDSMLENDAVGSIDNIVKSYARKPDCFRLAARRIRARCADIEMDADERVKAAISMTLCELRTAEFHSIPLECEVFLEEGGLGDRAPHSVCVEALSRSTQSWASYSGYLREIPQLCLVYQQSNEKDLALEIYRNATIEKVAYIRHLVKRAEKDDESHARWQSLLVDLQRSIDSLQVSPGLADKIYIDIADTILNELQQVMRTQKRAFDEHLQESTEHSLALSDHARTLVSLSTEFERDFSARMNTAYELLDSRLSEVFAASDKMWQQVTLIEKGLLSAMNMIAQLSTSANHLSDALTSGAHEIKSMHIAQANAVRATARLAGTLQQMDETVINALVEINNTAIRVSQTIGKGLNSFHPNLVSFAGATIIYLKQVSLLRLAASAVVWLMWFILQQSYSFLAMPCVVAIISLLRWLPGKIFPGKGPGASPCVCQFKASRQTSAAPTPTVILPAPATPWPRRRASQGRPSQFSRIPDRLCRRLDN